MNSTSSGQSKLHLLAGPSALFVRVCVRMLTFPVCMCILGRGEITCTPGFIVQVAPLKHTTESSVNYDRL